MHILLDESFEDWSNRVQQYEYGRALMQIAQLWNIDSVMTEMSLRIVNKLKHHIIRNLSTSFKYNNEESKRHYKEKYLNLFGPKPDHVTED